MGGKGCRKGGGKQILSTVYFFPRALQCCPLVDKNNFIGHLFLISMSIFEASDTRYLQKYLRWLKNMYILFTSF